MQFGAFLPTYWTEYRDRSLPAALADVARAADALGYDSVWANDHVLAPPQHASLARIIEPLITLASLVHLVPRLHLGTSVLVLPQRHAIIVAKQAAALDVLSQGRLILGIGSGWMEEEFRLLQANFAQRGAITDEAIAVMQTLWREQTATFHGQFYSFSDALFFPKPPRGGPPLWIGGNTMPALRRAARVGAAWVPFWSGLGSFQRDLDRFRSRVATLHTLTDGQNKLRVAAHVRMRIRATGEASETDEAASAAAIIDLLQQYQQAGLEYLICDFLAHDVEDLLRQMQVMMETIAPQC